MALDRYHDDDFNSHARVGRDTISIQAYDNMTISTHTPV